MAQQDCLRNCQMRTEGKEVPNSMESTPHSVAFSTTIRTQNWSSSWVQRAKAPMASECATTIEMKTKMVSSTKKIRLSTQAISTVAMGSGHVLCSRIPQRGCGILRAGVPKSPGRHGTVPDERVQSSVQSRVGTESNLSRVRVPDPVNNPEDRLEGWDWQADVDAGLLEYAGARVPQYSGMEMPSFKKTNPAGCTSKTATSIS